MIYISVVVPFFNQEIYIEKCIQALLEQDYPKEQYEIIFVNNNSSDQSLKIVEKYPVTLLDQKKQGAYAARNLGIQKAQGQVIAFTDSDCVPREDWLQRIHLAMQNSSCRFVLGKRGHMGGGRCLALLDAYEEAKMRYVFTSKCPDIVFGYTNNMAVRKDLLKQMGGFLEISRGADTILAYKLSCLYGVDAGGFEPSMFVLHQEIKAYHDYFLKVMTYGQSSVYYQQNIAQRGLSLFEKWQIFTNTAKNYQWPKNFILFLLLVVGYFYWLYGRFKSILSKTFAKKNKLKD